MSSPEPVAPPPSPTVVRAAPPALTVRSTPQIDHLFATLVDAAFDLMEEIGNISLATYLHVPHDDQPLLFARKPQLDMLDPTETFRLMHTITMLSNGRKPVAAFRHGDLSGHYIRTTGTHSDGLFVFGAIQAPETAKRITAVSRAFTRVLHQFHLDDGDDGFEPPLLAVDTVDGITQAVVTIEADGIHQSGNGNDPRPEDAVAKAVMQAIAPDHTFSEVRTINVGARSAVLVVAHDANGVLRLGLAISSGDVLQTTAEAAKRAIVDVRDSNVEVS